MQMTPKSPCPHCCARGSSERGSTLSAAAVSVTGLTLTLRMTRRGPAVVARLGFAARSAAPGAGSNRHNLARHRMNSSICSPSPGRSDRRPSWKRLPRGSYDSAAEEQGWGRSHPRRLLPGGAEAMRVSAWPLILDRDFPVHRCNLSRVIGRSRTRLAVAW